MKNQWWSAAAVAGALLGLWSALMAPGCGPAYPGGPDDKGTIEQDAGADGAHAPGSMESPRDCRTNFPCPACCDPE